MTNVSVPRELLEKMRDLIYVLAHREDSIGEDACIVGSHFPDLLEAPAVEVEGLEVFTVPGRYLAVNRKNPGAQDVVLLTKTQAVIEQLTIERDAARESMHALDELTDQQAARIAELEDLLSGVTATRSMDRLLLRFKSSDRLNNLYYYFRNAAMGEKHE